MWDREGGGAAMSFKKSSYSAETSHSTKCVENSSVSITVGTQKENKEIEMTNQPQEPKHLQRPGPLGLCNNPYCMTCPRHYQKKEVPEKNRRDQDGEPRKWNRNFLFHIYQVIPVVTKCTGTKTFVNPHSTFVHWWNKVFLISCLMATFVDPLFFFLLSVQQGKKCVAIDWTLAWIVVGLRSFTDIIYFLHILLQFKLAYITPKARVAGSGVLVDDLKKIAHNYLSGWFWIDLFVVLPLPQIITLFVRSKLLLLDANDTKTILGLVVLFQYVPRLCRFLPMLAGQSTNGFIFETGWANFVINLLSFLLAGHIIGSSWYLFGLQRVNRCLKNACNDPDSIQCKQLIDCGPGSDDKQRDAWRNNISVISCFGVDGFRYGIYLQAVNLTTERSMVTRYIYSLFWGFQQISTLAGNQIPSYYVWEVLFTMAIVVFGLLLFALLIGNMQNFLQALGRRRLEMMLRQRDVDQWMSHRRLPDDVKRKVREAERYSWIANRGVDEQKLLVNLPEDLQKDIRRHIFDLKKVRIFSVMDEAVLDSISERLRQKTYIVGCQILFPGGPINKMTFIVRGEMESVGEHKTQLSAEDVCGEELLTWCLEDPFRSQGIYLYPFLYDMHTSYSEVSEGLGRLAVTTENINVDPVVSILSICHSANWVDTLRVLAFFPLFSVPKHQRTTRGKPISKRTVTCLSNVEAFTLGAADLEEVVCLFAEFLRNRRVQEAIRSQCPREQQSA